MAVQDNDPFYFSDTIRDIDDEAPFVLLGVYQMRKDAVALLCVDATSGEESLYVGYVKAIDYRVLKIGMLDGRDASIEITNADFYSLKREDAPPKLKAVTTDSYAAGMRFHTGKVKGYLLAQRSGGR